MRLFAAVAPVLACLAPLWGGAPDLERVRPLSREYARDGKAWRPARFVCDRRDSVVFALPSRESGPRADDEFTVVRFKKRDPASRSRERFKASDEGDCAMQKCVSRWRSAASGGSLYLQESSYRDPAEGVWTGDRYVSSEDPLAQSGGGWGEPCSNERFLSLLCVTARRTVFVTRDARGGARYRSVNFDPKKPAGVDLTSPPGGVETVDALRRFTFKSGHFSYVVEVLASEKTPSARIVVKDKEKVLQTEDCAQYLWTELAPDAK